MTSPTDSVADLFPVRDTTGVFPRGATAPRRIAQFDDGSGVDAWWYLGGGLNAAGKARLFACHIGVDGERIPLEPLVPQHNHSGWIDSDPDAGWWHATVVGAHTEGDIDRILTLDLTHADDHEAALRDVFGPGVFVPSALAALRGDAALDHHANDSYTQYRTVLELREGLYDAAERLRAHETEWATTGRPSEREVYRITRTELGATDVLEHELGRADRRSEYEPSVFDAAVLAERHRTDPAASPPIQTCLASELDALGRDAARDEFLDHHTDRADRLRTHLGELAGQRAELADRLDRTATRGLGRDRRATVRELSALDRAIADATTGYLEHLANIDLITGPPRRDLPLPHTGIPASAASTYPGRGAFGVDGGFDLEMFQRSAADAAAYDIGDTDPWSHRRDAARSLDTALAATPPPERGPAYIVDDSHGAAIRPPTPPRRPEDTMTHGHTASPTAGTRASASGIKYAPPAPPQPPPARQPMTPPAPTMHLQRHL